MTTATTNFAFGKPVVGGDSDTWGTETNTIFDSIDAILATGRWVAASGTVDAITAAYSPAVTVLTDGMIVAFRAVGANTSTTPTFSPNGLTARTITKEGGNALVAGDIPGANYECLLRYYAVSTQWELLNPVGATSGTWTPAIGGTATYSGQTGTWKRVGKLVYVRCSLTINAIGTGSATQISGLPFAAISGARPLSVGFFSGIVTAVTALMAYTAGSSISFSCLTAAATSVTDTPNVFQNGARVEVSGVYETA